MGKLYVAYGSNLNIAQMALRCPTARIHGTGQLNNWELIYRGSPVNSYATIHRKGGSRVPVVVWEIQEADEQSLDRYEGYPSHYFKQNVPVQLDGMEVSAMVYVMNLKMHFGMPSPYYYQTVQEGFFPRLRKGKIISRRCLTHTTRRMAMRNSMSRMKMTAKN